MTQKKINQTGNQVDSGDIIAGNKNEHNGDIYNFVTEQELKLSEYTGPMRDSLPFDPAKDGKNTTLKKKMNDGDLPSQFIDHAIKTKIQTLGLLLEFIQTEAGKKIIADLYSNLESIIHNKYLSQTKNYKLNQSTLKDLFKEYTVLANKYTRSSNPVDEAFVEGMLYIATSNCALYWESGNDT